MKIFVVSPVRTTSSRMRGKIFWPLGGKSMLENFIERIQRAKLIDGICIACPPRDLAEFKEFTKGWGIEIVAPDLDESDLIGRLYLAGKAIGADFVVRICADNPCIEPEYLDWLASQIPSLPSPLRGLWLNSENFLNDHDGFGGEIYSYEMLKWMDDTIKGVRHREHPHTFWKDLGLWTYMGKDYARGLRLEVNTEKEYRKLVKIYDHFGNNLFHVEEAIEYVRTIVL